MIKTLSEPSTFFWTRDGQALKNIEELSVALENISPETFAHHVNSDRNDFSNWLNDILEEGKLADKIRSLSTKEEIASLVEKRLKQIKRSKPNKKAVLTHLKDTFSNG